MKTLRAWMTLVPLVLGIGSASALQAWVQPYEAGLKAAKSNNWAGAREAFTAAIANRPDDYSLPTVLPGPPTEQRRWRNGSPYSPNFLIAYCDYRLALNTAGASQTSLLNKAASGLESLLSKGQVSRAAGFYLDVIYSKLQEREKRAAALAKVGAEPTWKIDTEILAPEELSAMGVAVALPTNPAPAANTTTNPTTSPNVTTTVATPGAVPAIANKYALIIGNGTARVAAMNLPFGADDAAMVRNALVDFAGYPGENIELVTNASAAQIKASVKALTDKVSPDATVFIYFTGAAANVGGKDFLLGVEAESATDAAAQVSKNDILQGLLNKGARVFSFFQVNRPMSDGNYFGSEIAPIGAVAQAQATIPGEMVYSLTRNGKSVGLYTDALVSVFSEFRSNQIPVMDFAWQVFYRVRRGNLGSTGGSSRQTPTLPSLSNMGFDARF